jgi:2-amino-4-hydroxy-6-hydroxymethyldihydropteridine diphosphokinase
VKKGTGTRVILSLGTNLGDLRGNLVAMKRRVSRILEAPVRYSRFMESEPVGVQDDQQWYFNQLVSGTFHGSARDLLEKCREIEDALGRTRPHHWAARTADVDILVFGDQLIQEPDLVIPHAQIPNRRFCLEGLMDIAPEMVIAGTGRTVSQMFGDMPEALKGQTLNFIEGPEEP